MNTFLHLIRPEWHAEFRKFVASGKASRAFMTYLNSDANCQKAVGLAIDALAAIFEDVEAPVSAPHTVLAALGRR
jgi:hypothetical protein